MTAIPSNLTDDEDKLKPAVSVRIVNRPGILLGMGDSLDKPQPSLQELEHLLAQARVKERLPHSPSASRQVQGEEVIRAARSEVRHTVLDLERRIAAAKGEPYAVPLDFPVRWDIGAPLPHVLVNDYKTFLAFEVRQDDPHWDGRSVKIADPNAAAPLALVEFERCSSAKLGAPNDEVLHGHTLSGNGLESYTAQVVMNSPWIAELQQINSVHRQYDPRRWADLNHYVFWFHDSTVECIARSYKVETFHEGFPALLARACKRLM